MIDSLVIMISDTVKWHNIPSENS